MGSAAMTGRKYSNMSGRLFKTVLRTLPPKSRGVPRLTEDNVRRHEHLVSVICERAEEEPHGHKRGADNTRAPRRALALEKTAQRGKKQREGERGAQSSRRAAHKKRLIRRQAQNKLKINSVKSQKHSTAARRSGFARLLPFSYPSILLFDT